MVHTHLRLKINLTMALTALFFVTAMWCFNTEVLTHDWAGSVDDLPMVGGIVGGLIITALLIIYLTLKPLVDCLKKIETGTAVTADERRRALRAMVRLPIVIILTNVVGFFLGPTAKLVPDSLLTGKDLFTPVPLLTIFYNTCIGLVSSLTIMLEHGAVLGPAKQLLNVQSREELTADRIKDLSLRLKNVLFPFAIALLFGAIIMVAGYSFYSRDISAVKTIAEKSARGEALTEREAAEAKAIGALFGRASVPAEARAEALRTLEGLFPGKEADFLGSLLAIFAVTLALVLGLAFFFSSETSVHLKQFLVNLGGVLEGRGNLSRRLPLVQYNELGELSSLYNRLITVLQTLLGKVKSEALETQSSAAMLKSSIEQCSRAMEEIAAASGRVNENSQRQAESMQTVEHAINAMLSSIEEVKESVASQAVAIEESSAAIHEMSESIASVSVTTTQARSMSEALMTLARDGEEKVSRTIQAIEEIVKTSALVAETTSVISGIASQTNLLAMNASIEAAHAGSFGRGFAVVADEVRKLAEESAQSAVQIGRGLDDMAHSVTDGADLSRETGAALGRITKDINQNTQIMTSISSAMEEQTAGTNEIMQLATGIVDTIQRIKTRTGDQAGKSQEIRGRMKELVSASVDIRLASDSQKAGLASLKEMISNLQTVMTANSRVVEELNEALEGFSLAEGD